MKLNLKQIRQFILVLTLLILVAMISFRYGQSGSQLFNRTAASIKLNRQVPASKQGVDFSLFWQVWDRVSTTFFDKSKIDPVKMVYGAISGMVAALGDPYTVFLTPVDNQRTEEDLAGEFGGVGVQLGYLDQQLAVIAPLSGSPAEKAGVKAGDLLLKVNDREMVDVSLPEAVDLIRGEKGTPVTLTLFRKDQKAPFDLVIVRDKIIVKSAEVNFLTDHCPKENINCPLIAHLKLSRFGDRTNSEWGEAVNQINQKCPFDSKKCAGVILDLRNNPGGYLDSSVFITSEFISSGIVVQEEDSDGKRQSFEVNRQGSLLSIPVAVLVNKGTASASEIVAGCLQQRKRALIVGETTFGKGTIQETQDFSGGAGLLITVAHWLLPNGESINKKGLTPDYLVETESQKLLEDLQLEKAILILTKTQ